MATFVHVLASANTSFDRDELVGILRDAYGSDFFKVVLKKDIIAEDDLEDLLEVGISGQQFHLCISKPGYKRFMKEVKKSADSDIGLPFRVGSSFEFDDRAFDLINTIAFPHVAGPMVCIDVGASGDQYLIDKLELMMSPTNHSEKAERYNPMRIGAFPWHDFPETNALEFLDELNDGNFFYWLQFRSRFADALSMMPWNDCNMLIHKLTDDQGEIASTIYPNGVEAVDDEEVIEIELEMPANDVLTERPKGDVD